MSLDSTSEKRKLTVSFRSWISNPSSAEVKGEQSPLFVSATCISAEAARRLCEVASGTIIITLYES